MKNPYLQNDKLLDSYVCYVDILGFKELIDQNINEGTGDKFLTTIRRILNHSYKEIYDRMKLLKDFHPFDMKIFTDNMIIGFPIKNISYDSGEPEIGIILQLLIRFQVNLLMEGLFVRGGIAKGKHYMDKNIVIGDALLQAINIEKNKKQPTIKLSDEVKELVHQQINYYHRDRKKSPQNYYFLKDNDGTYFINYLSEAFAIFPDGPIFFEVIKKHKYEIEKNLHIVKNQNISEKYEWLAGYHNFILKENANEFPIIDEQNQPSWYTMASENAQQSLLYIVNYQSVEPSRITFPDEK